MRTDLINTLEDQAQALRQRYEHWAEWATAAAAAHLDHGAELPPWGTVGSTPEGTAGLAALILGSAPSNAQVARAAMLCRQAARLDLGLSWSYALGDPFGDPGPDGPDGLKRRLVRAQRALRRQRQEKASS